MADSSAKTLFPPYLNRGSRGGAVDCLHMLLDGFGCGQGIVADLEYGQVTADRVADLQRWLGIEADGQFGPATREALLVKTFLDVDRINWAPQNGLTDWMGPDGQMGVWPE